MPRELRHRSRDDVQRGFSRRGLARPGRRDSGQVQMRAGAARINPPNHAERLAKGLPKAARNARPKRRGKGAARARPRRHAGGAVADARSVSPIVRLIQSLGEEKVRLPIPQRPEKVEGAKMIWLPDMDLNHDKQIQSLLCYRYTIGQTGAGDNLVSPHPESSG